MISWLSDDDYNQAFEAHSPVKVHKDPSDPVVRGPTDLFYFYDEHWCNISGPYYTEEDCREALRRYARQL